MQVKRIWLAVGAGVALIGVLCCAGVITFFTWLGQDDPDDVVDDYLEAVQEEDSSRARELTCSGWRGVTGVLTNWTDVVDWDITDTDRHDESAEVTARVTFRVMGVASSSRMVFTLVKEDGEWKVCGATPTSRAP